MDYLVIEGVQPWDGRYEFNFDGSFTVREWGWIKRYSGYMPLTVEQGLDGGDPELYACFAAIALHRAGKVEARGIPDFLERLADSPFDKAIRLELEGSAKDDAGPPAPSSNGNASTSGDGSPTSSATSDKSPSPTGTSSSVSSEFGHPTSVS